MPEHKDHTFVHENGSKVIVHTRWDQEPSDSTAHTIPTVEICLQDYKGGNKVTLWHNGERWIVRLDERALGDHNNFECVDQWELRSPSEAYEQFVTGLEDECND